MNSFTWRDLIRDQVAAAWRDPDTDILETLERARRSMDVEKSNWEKWVHGEKPEDFKKDRPSVLVSRFQVKAVEDFGKFVRNVNQERDPRNFNKVINSFILPVFFHQGRHFFSQIEETIKHGNL